MAAQHRLYPLFHLIAYRGLRRGEAVGLRWQDVDLEAGFIRISQQVVQLGWATAIGDPKSNSGERTISLDEGTIAALRNWRSLQDGEQRSWGRAWHDTALVFTREDGSQLHPDMATSVFRAAAPGRRAPADPAPRSQTHSGKPGLAGQRAAQGRLGATRPQLTRDHSGHLHQRPASGRACRRRGRRRHHPANPFEQRGCSCVSSPLPVDP